MQKLSILAAVIALVLCSCGSNGRKSTIVVSTEDAKADQYVIVAALSSETAESDTLSFSNDGKGSRSYSQKISIPTYFAVIPQSGKSINLLVNPGEKVRIQTDNLSFDNWTVSGSKESEKIVDLDRHIDSTLAKIDSLNNVLMSFQNSPNLENIRIVLEMNYNQILEEQKQYNADFIDQNLNSLSSIYALFQRYPDGSFVFNDAEDLPYFLKVDSALYSNVKFRSSSYIRMMHVNVSEIKEQNRQNQMEELVNGLGMEAPEISLPGTNGSRISLSSLRGKYVLLDFWAGWCQPCRMENPNIKANYERFSKYGFDVYQVSLDRDRNQWLKAIADDGIGAWKHVSDLKYWDSEVVEKFNLNSIPANLLLDQEGAIIARNLRGQALTDKLTEIFESGADGE